MLLRAPNPIDRSRRPTKPPGQSISVLIETESKNGDDLLSGASSSVVHAFYASVALHALSLSPPLSLSSLSLSLSISPHIYIHSYIHAFLVLPRERLSTRRFLCSHSPKHRNRVDSFSSAALLSPITL